jgi:hypothetical protein
VRPFAQSWNPTIEAAADAYNAHSATTASVIPATHIKVFYSSFKDAV